MRSPSTQCIGVVGLTPTSNAFHTLADSWWEMPKLDQGYGCYSGAAAGFNQNNNTCFAVAAWRSMALTGVVLRASRKVRVRRNGPDCG